MQIESGRIERSITALAILGALGWLPYMITWWMSHAWPAYPETYFVGLVVIPLAIFFTGRLLAAGVTLIRRWRQTSTG